MAALTKRHEVALVVRTAACQRQDVMHFFGGRYPTFLFTLLAQRMRLDINPSYAPPRATIPLVGVRIATVSVVLTFGDLPVLIAVPSVGQPAASRIGAGALWFIWHLLLLWKPAEAPARAEAPHFFLSILNQITFPSDIQ